MLLAIDTATRQISLALHDGHSLLSESSWRSAHHHTVELAPSLALLLRRAGVAPAQLAGVAVAQGPGSYTSLRIGLALAKGLALAHGLPLAGVPTFDILMRAQPPRPERALAVLPAGRGRASVQAYVWDAGAVRWQPEGEVRLLDWVSLVGEVHQPTYLCGEIDSLGHAALRPRHEWLHLAEPALSLRRAGFLAEIGWERLRAGQVDDARSLAPVYGGQPEGMA